MSERPTPETDSNEYPAETLAIAAEKIMVVHSDFARRLERQLAEAREYQESETRWAAQYKGERDEAREQRDRLAEACKKLMKVIGPPNATIEQCWAGVDEIDEAYIEGEQAIALVSGGQQ